MYSCTSWFAIVGRPVLELPSDPPAGVAVTWPKAFVTVQLTGAGTPVEDLTLTPTPSAPPVTVSGTVSDGVEAGCLVLTTDDGTYTLIGQTRGLTAGRQVTLRGVPAPDVLTTCQQGTPFRVLEVL